MFFSSLLTLSLFGRKQTKETLSNESVQMLDAENDRIWEELGLLRFQI